MTAGDESPRLVRGRAGRSLREDAGGGLLVGGVARHPVRRRRSRFSEVLVAHRRVLLAEVGDRLGEFVVAGLAPILVLVDQCGAGIGAERGDFGFAHAFDLDRPLLEVGDVVGWVEIFAELILTLGPCLGSAQVGGDVG